MAKTNSVRTSRKVAKIASEVLRDGRTSKVSKKLAGQALGNRKKTSKR